MADDKPTQSKKAVIAISIVVTIVALIIVFNIVQYGFIGGLNFTVNNAVKYSFWIFIFGLAIVGAYLVLFYQFEKDINEINKRNILDETSLSNPEGLSHLWTQGDKEHKPKRLGKIVGYSRRQNLAGEPEDIFTIRRNLIKKDVVRCRPEHHTRLHGDVFLKCISLVKPVGFYYYPNTMHLKTEELDCTIFSESLRFSQVAFGGSIETMMRKASGLTKSDLEEIKSEPLLHRLKDKKSEVQGSK